jgi:hypothetical protein
MIDDSLPSTAIVFNQQIKGNPTILNHLFVVPIIVRAVKSMTVPSLPLRVQGPIRLTA